MLIHNHQQDCIYILLNLHEHDVCGIWNVGSGSYSSYRIWEHKHEREQLIRDYKLSQVFKKFTT